MIESQPTPQTYPDLLATLKARIRDARLRAAVSVNRELILLTSCCIGRSAAISCFDNLRRGGDSCH
jgi:hypothetical protein